LARESDESGRINKRLVIGVVVYNISDPPDACIAGRWIGGCLYLTDTQLEGIEGNEIILAAGIDQFIIFIDSFRRFDINRDIEESFIIERK
jgi:hypothetical protein